MSGSIPISQKHGVNPSVQKCFWCGKDFGVVLFGRLPRHRAEKMFGKEFMKKNTLSDITNATEVEAPRSVVLGLEPCDGCTVWAHSKEGVFFVEAEMDDGAPRPTGSFNCVREEAVRRMLDPGDLLDSALKSRIAYMHPDDFKQIFRDVKAE